AADQLLLDRLGVDLLEPPRGAGPVQRGDLGEQRLGVLVARPQPFEVEDGKAAEPPDGDRGGGTDHAVHRRDDQRDLEAVGVDLPGDAALLGIARPAGRHDADVVEGVRPAAALATADLHLSSHCALPLRRPGSAYERATLPEVPADCENEAEKSLRQRPPLQAHAAGRPGDASGRSRSAALVVGGLDGHLDVVGVALAEARGADAHEAAAFLELGDRARPRVPHGLVEAADELVRDVGEGAAVGDLPLHALGDQLLLAADVALRVAVLGEGPAALAVAHRAERAHAAVRLVLLAV